MGALTPRWVPGLLCHLDDACVSNPCHEDAICDTNPVNGRAICTCPPGFTGGACDQDVDECSIGGWGGTQGWREAPVGEGCPWGVVVGRPFMVVGSSMVGEHRQGCTSMSDHHGRGAPMAGDTHGWWAPMGGGGASAYGDTTMDGGHTWAESTGMTGPP